MSSGTRCFKYVSTQFKTFIGCWSDSWTLVSCYVGPCTELGGPSLYIVLHCVFTVSTLASLSTFNFIIKEIRSGAGIQSHQDPWQNTKYWQQQQIHEKNSTPQMKTRFICSTEPEAKKNKLKTSTIRYYQWISTSAVGASIGRFSLKDEEKAFKR